MKVDLRSPRSYRVETVTVGEDSFQVTLRSPSYADRMQEIELSRGERDGQWLAHRLRSVLVSWSGLSDQNGEAIKFSETALAAVCEAVPEIHYQLMSLAADEYARTSRTEDQRGNSPGASTDSSGAEAP